MAEYLIQDTTLTAIGDAIRAKEGSSGAIPVSAFANRISAISTGVTAQNKAGTFTTNTRGKATVNCGFKPDYVIISRPRTGITEAVYSATAHFAHNPDGIGTFSLIFYELSDDVFLYSIDVTQTNTGFSVFAETVGQNMAYSTAVNVTFNYYAVKYE